MVKKAIYLTKLKDLRQFLVIVKKTLNTNNEEFIEEILETEIDYIFDLIENFEKIKIY